MTLWDYVDRHPLMAALWWAIAFAAVFLGLDFWRSLKLRAVASAEKVAGVLEPRILAAVVQALEIDRKARRGGPPA